MLSTKGKHVTFNIGVSPPKKIKNEEAPAVLILAPFSGVPKLEFIDIKKGSSCTKNIEIRNPTEEEISIELQLPPEIKEPQFSLSHTTYRVPPNSSVIFEIIWTPEEEGNWRYTIPVKNLNGTKKFSHVILFCRTFTTKTKPARKRGTVSSKVLKPKHRGVKSPGTKKVKPTPASHETIFESLETEPILEEVPICDLPSTSDRRKTYTKEKTDIPKFPILDACPKIEPVKEDDSPSPRGLISPQKRSIDTEDDDTPKKPRVFDPAVFSLKPSSNIPTLIFNNVKRYSSTVRQLIIRNPTSSEIKIVLSPPLVMSAHKFVFSSTDFRVPRNGERVLEISWSPYDVGEWEFAIPVKNLTGPDQFPDIVLKSKCISTRMAVQDPMFKSPMSLGAGSDDSPSMDLLNNPEMYRLKDDEEDYPRGSLSTLNISPTPRRTTYTIVKSPMGSLSTFNVSPSPIRPTYTSPETSLDENNHLTRTTRRKSSRKSHDLVTNTSQTRKTTRAVKKTPKGKSNATFTYEGDSKDSSFDISPVHCANIDSSYTTSINDSQMCSTPIDENSLLKPASKRRNLTRSFGSPKEEESQMLSPFRLISPQTLGEDSPGAANSSKDVNLSSNSTDVNLSIKSTDLNLSSKSTDVNLSTKSTSSTKSKKSTMFEVSPPVKTTRRRKQAEPTPAKVAVKRKSDGPSGELKVPRRSLRLLPTSGPGSRKRRLLARTYREEQGTGTTYIKPAKKPAPESSYLSDGNDELFLGFPSEDTAYPPCVIEDPFAKHAIYPNEYLDKQELELIKWLNTVLTPPEELESNTAGVDVTELWKKAITKEKIELAPSRDVVSTTYHSDPQRLASLRKAAVTLIQSNEIAKVLNSVLAKVSKDLLSVKDDIDLHFDQGARCKLVSLVLHYNPLWLRIGLEAIYRRPIPLQNSRDVHGLLIFLKKNFLSNDDIMLKHSHSKVVRLKLPTFKREMNNYIVFKFLTLIFLLDKAKMRRMIPYDPCLFCKNSPIKESEAMLNEFIKEYLKCVGHMKKSLAAIGYKLQYKQTHLDEFDFAVASRSDLRDGVRLARVMEIILHNPSFCSKLRTPAISKLQKIHNAGITFTALKEANFEIRGEITPKDIVEGHREKTMSLVWQILNNFLKPRYEASARKIQKWWKRKGLLLEIKRRIALKLHLQKEKAALLIQSLWRGYWTRCLMKEKKKKLLEEKHLRHQSAIVIQSAYRGLLLKRKFNKLKESAMIIQEFWRRCLKKKLCTKERQDFLKLKSASLLIQNRWRFKQYSSKREKAAFKIQNWFKVANARKRLLEIAREERRRLLEEKDRRLRSAIIIQSFYRMTLAKRHFLSLKKSALCLQRHFKLYLEKKRQLPVVNQCRNEFLRVKSSITCIQRFYRAYRVGKLEMTKYYTLKRATLFVQNRWKFLKFFGKKKKAAVIIQSTFRMYKVKKDYHKMRVDVIKAQRIARILLEKKKMLPLVNQCKTDFAQTKAAILFVQIRWRFLRHFKSKKRVLLMEKSAVCIQEHYKAYRLRKEERRRFLKLKRAAILIQGRWRFLQHLKKLEKLRKEEIKLKQLQRATLFVQNRWCFIVHMRQKRQQLLRAVSFVQCRWRFLVLLMKKKVEAKRKEQEVMFQQLIRATYFIQSRWRFKCHLAKKKLELAKLEEEKKLQIRTTIFFQNRWRFIQCLKKKRERERRQEEARVRLLRTTVLVQNRWRFIRHMREKRESERRQEEARVLLRTVVCVQNRWRFIQYLKKKRECERRQEEARVLLLRTAVFVQDRWCFIRHMRKKRESERRQEEARVLLRTAVFVQNRWRFVQCLKKKRESERRQEEARVLLLRTAIFVQNRWRLIRYLKKKRESERRQEEARVLLLRTAAFVQDRWHFTRHMRKKRESESRQEEARVLLLRTAIFVQNRWRFVQYLKKKRESERRQEEARVLLLRTAIFVQNRWRFIRHMKKKIELARIKKAVEEKMALIRAAKFVQCRWRFIRQMIRKKMEENRRLREEKEKLRAVELIQSRWRFVKHLREKEFELAKLRKEEEDSARLVGTALFVQDRWRYCRQIKKKRLELVKTEARLIKAVVFLQCRWRFLYMQRVKAKLEEQKLLKATLFVQCRWRFIRSTKKSLEEGELTKAALYVQTRWRFLKQTRKAKKESEAAILIQKNYRMFRARKHFRTVIDSVKIIQRWYRQMQSKDNQPVSKPNTQKKKTLEHLFYRSCSFLKHIEPSMGEMESSFTNLDTVTYLSPVLCERFSNSMYFQGVIWHTLNKQCRSDPYQVVFTYGLNILINLSVNTKTVDQVWKTLKKFNGLDILFILMSKFVTSNPDLFNRCCTLLWHIARIPAYSLEIAQYHECEKKLLRLYTRLGTKPFQDKKKYSKTFPGSEPQWGGYKKRGRFFVVREQALDALMTLLKFQ